MTPDDVTSIVKLANLVAVHKRSLSHAARGHKEQPPPASFFENAGDGCEGAYTAVVERDEERGPEVRLRFEVEDSQRLACSGAADCLDMVAEALGRNLVKGCIGARKPARVALIAANYVVIH